MPVSILARLMVGLACLVVLAGGFTAEVVALPAGPDRSGGAADLAARVVPDDIPFRQADPELTVTKTNNVGGQGGIGAPWAWTLQVRNTGPTPAVFAAGQVIVSDTLPGDLTYNAVAFVTVGGATGPFGCSNSPAPPRVLTCTAAGAGFTIPQNGGIDVSVAAVASAPGTYTNPTGGACLVDPNDVIDEQDDTNNACNSDTVTVPGPDLTATKTNTVGGAATVGAPWTWTITIANGGALPATFAAGQAVLFDHLPETGVTYGTPVVSPAGGAGGPLNCSIDFTVRLSCFAIGGAVTMPPGGSFLISVAATATVPGVYANPHPGGVCVVDPNSVVAELVETNNACSDTVSTLPRDLTAIKSNNVNGAAQPNVPWTWTVALANAGTGTAAFAAGQVVLTDALPATGLTYGAPVATATGGATGTLTCAIAPATATLTCTANGGPITFPSGGGFQVAFTAVAATPGAYANPRAGGACQVDPNGLVAETSEANNACANAVTVSVQAVPVAPAPPQGVANDANNDDEDEDDRPLSETQRHQRSRTNASGLEDERTEGNVLEVRCDTSSPPEYEVSFPTHTPYLVIGTRDGNQQLRLLYDTRKQCRSTRVGDYAEADGDKEHELLFNAHNLTTRRR